MGEGNGLRRRGRGTADPLWVRSYPVKAMFRPGEYDDLVHISEGWGVPVGTAMWAIVHDQLARWRRQAPQLGEHGLAIAGALAVLRQKRDRARDGASQGGGTDVIGES